MIMQDVMDKELRRPSSILNELDQLHEVIDENRRLIEENPSELALQINLMSLECREHDLLEELHESNEKMLLDTFDFDIEGKNVVNHSISSAVLGDILLGLQGTLDSIAYSLKEGPSNSRGPIPESIISSSRVDMAAACGGSFRIILTSSQPALIESVVKESLRRLNSLLDCQDDKELIKQEIKDLGARAINKYKKFLEIIYKTKSQIKMYDILKPAGFETKVITADLAERIWKVIDQEESIPDKEEEYRGTIRELNLFTQKFQFLIESSGKKINGSFDPGLDSEMKCHFDEFTVACFKVSSKQNEATGELYKEYTLLRFID